MGARMAGNLMKRGTKLVVFDADHSKAEAFKSADVDFAESPAEVAASTKQIVTMLPESMHVKNAFLSKDGILAYAI